MESGIVCKSTRPVRTQIGMELYAIKKVMKEANTGSASVYPLVNN